HELKLRLAYGPTAIAVKGWASAETERAYSRARALAERLDESSALFSVLFGLWVNHLVRSHFHAAYEIGEELLSLATRTEAPTLLLQANQALGDTLYHMGEFHRARTYLETTLSLCGRERL